MNAINMEYFAKKKDHLKEKNCRLKQSKIKLKIKTNFYYQRSYNINKNVDRIAE